MKCDTVVGGCGGYLVGYGVIVLGTDCVRV